MRHTINIMEAFDTNSRFETVNQKRVKFEYYTWYDNLMRWINPHGYVHRVGAYRIPETDRFFLVYQLIFPSKTEFNKMKLMDKNHYALGVVERLGYTYQSNIEWVREDCSYPLLETYHEV